VKITPKNLNFRFIDNLSNKRRQQQEHFAGSALSDSNLKQEVVDDSSVNGGKYDISDSSKWR